jgi:hypothetical protein
VLSTRSGYSGAWSRALIIAGMSDHNDESGSEWFAGANPFLVSCCARVADSDSGGFPGRLWRNHSDAFIPNGAIDRLRHIRHNRPYSLAHSL